MARCFTQSLHGPSSTDYLRCLGAEDACAEAIRRARWPDGFACPRCGGTAHGLPGSGSQRLPRSNAGHHRPSLIAGDLLPRTTLPLTLWFLAPGFDGPIFIANLTDL